MRAAPSLTPMSLMSFNRHQLRRLAAFVLLGWVFALGVSVAHACGLVPSQAHEGHGVDAVRNGMAVHHAATAADEPAPGSSNPSCVKFCDESKNLSSGSGTVTVTASAPAQLDSIALLLPPADLAVLPPRAAWMRDQGRRPARELPIELLRLTL